MTEQYEVDKRIEKEFIAEWTNGIPFFFMNAPSKKMPATYINVLSMTDSEENICIGRVRTFCSLIGEIRTPLGVGVQAAQELASTFRNIFRNNDIGGISFTVGKSEPGERGTHYGIDVMVSYDWDSNVVLT